jgi:hypothetical protein
VLPPASLPSRRVRLAPEHLHDDDTQPVLRFTVRPRSPLTVEEAAATA